MKFSFSMEIRILLLLLSCVMTQSAISGPPAVDSSHHDPDSASDDRPDQNGERLDLETLPRSELLEKIRQLQKELSALKSSNGASVSKSNSPNLADGSAANGSAANGSAANGNPARSSNPQEARGSTRIGPPQKGKSKVVRREWTEQSWGKGNLIFPVSIERAMYMDAFQTGPQPRMR